MFYQILDLTGKSVNETIIPDPVSNVFSEFFGIIVALGGIFLLYLIFAIANFLLERKKYREIRKISKRLDKIEKILIDKKFVKK